MPRHPDSDLYRCASCSHAFGFPREHETYDDDYYEIEHRRWFDHPNTALFDQIAEAIPPASAVLDAGCGKGDFLRHLHAQRQDLKLTGLDFTANENTNGIRYLQGDVMTLDPGKFDAVVSLAVIEHIPDVTEFVRRLYSFVRPGGVVAIMTVNESSLLYRLARATRPVTPITFNRLYSAHHVHHFTRQSLESLLQSRGARIERSWTHNMPLAAIDIPAEGIAGAVLRAGMWGVCVAGDRTGMAYLQTVIART
ncbi:MAG TPA: class I SAM-dependent methyltransferase [Solirubrobacterales bacterium]|nr:class I SAM-dependent methyltransferase [Solirubrobacterales bacterium]